MADRDLESPAFVHLRAGLRVSIVSIGWTLSASFMAVAIGVSSGSLVLVAFGVTGVLDALGSATLAAHFRHALDNDRFSERRERIALRVVTGGLLAVGGLTGIESVRRLLSQAPAHAAPAGLALAALSTAVLAVLSRHKIRVAHRIPSRALLADGWLTATGCVLAVVTVAGTGLASAFGWWWVDPAAAMAVAVGAIGVAVAMTRG